MKKVIEESLHFPKDQKHLFRKVDFQDTFSTVNHKDSLKTIAQLIFNSPPKWVIFLMGLRNTIVGLFGLTTSMPDDYNEDFIEGAYVSFFKIYGIKEHEIILGADDTHLNFRAIIQRKNEEQYNIKITTLVEFNNRFGRIYMALIKPFHRVIIKALVKKAYIAKP